jgi:hypothetical protein
MVESIFFPKLVFLRVANLNKGAYGTDYKTKEAALFETASLIVKIPELFDNHLIGHLLISGLNGVEVNATAQLVAIDGNVVCSG